MKRQSTAMGLNETNLLKRLVKADEMEIQTYTLKVEINKLKKNLDDNVESLKDMQDKLEKSNGVFRELKKNVIFYKIFFIYLC